MHLAEQSQWHKVMLIPKLSAVFIYTCHGKYSRKDIKRFLSHIKINKKTGCWEWIGYVDKRGYGNLTIMKNGKQNRYYIHRIAWELFHNRFIPDEMCVCHHCDNPRCVNVLVCLFLGTHQENMEDRNNKNRQSSGKGEGHGSAKLTWIQVKEIRRLYNTGKYSQRRLAKIFNLIQATIKAIIQNKIWYDKDYIRIYFLNNRTNKLNQEQANIVRLKYSTGKYTQQQLANELNVSQSCINNILIDKTWKQS